LTRHFHRQEAPDAKQPIATQWRPQFEAALEKLAEISSAMDELDLKPPILVGGGAVELYTRAR
jgi:hypothetical protein